MLATFTGTAGNDSFELFAAPGNRIYEVRLNGQSQGTTQEAQITLVGLGGNDTFSIDSVYRDNIVGTPYEIEALGGLGDDTYLFGNFVSSVRLIELPSQGNDGFSIDQTFHIDGTSGARTLTTQTNSIIGGPADSLQFDDNLEGRQVFYGDFELDLTVKGQIPAGLTLVLGNRKNKVTYIGNNKQIDQDFLPGRISGGSGEDTVIFDDSAGNPTVNRNYSVTATAFMNQSFTGVDKAEIKTRINTTVTANNVFMTGAGTVGSSITFSNAATNAALTPTRLFIGTQTTPVDLDNIALQVNATFISDQQLLYEIWDQDANSSGNPFIIDVDSNRQIVEKGPFVGRFNNTQVPGGAGIALQINGGSTNDLFRLNDVLPLSRVTVNGGGGNDTLLPIADANHGNAPEQVFLGTSFVYDGGAGGNDIVNLDDRSAAFPGGVDEYQISSGFTKNGRLWMTHRGVERVNFFAGGLNNVIRIDTRDTPDNSLDKFYSIDAGSGSDTITTVIPGLSAGALGASVGMSLVGGIGIDTLEIDDTLAQSPTDQYSLSATSFSYAGAGAAGTFDFTGVENVVLLQNGRSSATDLRGKPAGGTLNLDAGGGNDTVTVSGGDLDSSGLLSTTGITLNGNAGNDSIVFDDRLDDQSDGATSDYTFGSFSLAKGTAAISYSTFENQTLMAANGVVAGQLNSVPVVNLNAINGFVNNTTIVGGAARLCTVNLGDGTLNNLGGTFNINLNNGFFDRILIRDQTNTFVGNFVVEAARITKGTQIFNYSGVTAMTLNAGAGNDTIDVRGVPAGMPLTVDAGLGSDTMFLGGGNVHANVLSPVLLHGATGTETITVDNTQDTTPDTFTLNGLSFTAGQTHTFSSVNSILILTGIGGDTVNVNSTAVPTTVTGGAGDDLVTVGGGNYTANILAALAVNGGGGDDSVVYSDTAPTTAQPYNFQNAETFFKTVSTPATITNSIEHKTLEASAGPDSINVMLASGDVRIHSNAGSDALDLTGTCAVNTGPSVTATGDSLLVRSGATVLVEASDGVGNVTIFGSGILRIPQGVVLEKAGTVFGVFGQVDLAGGSMLFRSGGVPQTSVQTLLSRGYNGGAWNGTNTSGAMNSSLANSTALLDAVGYGLGAQVAPTTVGPFAIAPGDMLVRYALGGDADLSGDVGIGDFSRVAANFNGTGKVWTTGDSNYDNATDIADFSSVAANFNMSIPFGLPRSGSGANLAGRFSERLLDDVLP